MAPLRPAIQLPGNRPRMEGLRLLLGPAGVIRGPLVRLRPTGLDLPRAHDLVLPFRQICRRT
jgi:hypothetical protein